MTQANVQVAAPGFLGINTEDSPTNLPLGWCAVADNAIIDSSGRIASRKGYRTLTATATALGTDDITNIHEANYADGTTERFATANNKIFKFSTTGVLTDITGVETITADDWQIATLNDDTYFFQRDHLALVYDKSADALTDIADHSTANGIGVPDADCCIAAYGRIWAAGVEGERSIVYWSDLLIGFDWNSGTSGSLDLTTLWPSGNDEVTAIVAHNQKLIVFGKRNILIFGSSNADGKLADPAADLFFEDGIVDVGCVSKHAWQVVGNDVWFADYSGLRSLGRTLQVKSLPLGELSRPVNTNLRNQLRTEDAETRMLYSPDDAFVLLLLPVQGVFWCFDTRQRMEDGSARVTQWTGLPFKSMGRSVDGTVWFGDVDGIHEYRGYLDAAASDGTGGTSFRFRYYTHPQTFEKPANLKIPKEVDMTIAGGLGQRAVCYWGYGYTYSYQQQAFTMDSVTPDFYNVDEYNITDADDPTEYGSGSTIGQYSIPLSGSGASLTIGFEANVRGQKLAVQEMNIQTRLGRMI